MPIIGVVIAIFIFAWAILGLMAIDPPKSKMKWPKERIDEPHEAAIAFGILGVAVAILGFCYVHVWHKTEDSLLRELISDFYGNVALTCIGITFTVLIIDRLNKRNAQNEEEKRFIRQIASPSHEFALEAVRLATETGLLYTGGMEGLNLGQAQLWGANLEGAQLRGARLDRAQLKDARLNYANLEGAQLCHADLRGTELCSTQLNHADLWGAQLNGADLWGANLAGANLYGTNLHGAIYNHATIWPDGFDPKAAGAISIDNKETEI